MGISEDLKAVILEMGTSFVIERETGDIVGEKFDSETNSQVTKPFIKEHFLEVTFFYDTQVVTGDIIRVTLEDSRYLVMNKTPESFEDTIINYQGIVYKCNVLGSILRPVPTLDPHTYRTSETWETVKENQYALLTEKLYGTRLEDEQPIGQFNVNALVLYVPKSVGMQVFDRWYMSEEKFYKAAYKEEHIFPGVDLVYLEEDTRP